MAVISRNGTQKFKLSLLHPRLAAHAVGHCLGDGVEHHIKRGVASHNYLIGIKPQNFTEKVFKLCESVKPSVISAVNSAYIFKAGIVAHKVEHFLT